MKRQAFIRLMRDTFGSRGAEWRITKEQTFDDWDGCFFLRSQLYNYMVANGEGQYLIEPYYANYLIDENSNKERHTFGETLIVNFKNPIYGKSKSN